MQDQSVVFFATFYLIFGKYSIIIWIILEQKQGLMVFFMSAGIYITKTGGEHHHYSKSPF